MREKKRNQIVKEPKEEILVTWDLFKKEKTYMTWNLFSPL